MVKLFLTFALLLGAITVPLWTIAANPTQPADMQMFANGRAYRISRDVKAQAELQGGERARACAVDRALKQVNAELLASGFEVRRYQVVKADCRYDQVGVEIGPNGEIIGVVRWSVELVVWAAPIE